MRTLKAASVTLLGWALVAIAALSAQRASALPAALVAGALAGRVESGRWRWEPAASWAAWLGVGALVAAPLVPRLAPAGEPLALVGIVTVASLAGALAASRLDASHDRWARVAARVTGMLALAASYRAGHLLPGAVLGSVTYAATLRLLEKTSS